FTQLTLLSHIPRQIYSHCQSPPPPQSWHDKDEMVSLQSFHLQIEGTGIRATIDEKNGSSFAQDTVRILRSRSCKDKNDPRWDCDLDSLGGETLSKNICILKSGRDIKHTNLTGSNIFSDKMNINLDVFSTLMLHMISRQIHSTDIITIDKSSSRERTLERDNVTCRLADQDKRLSPRNTQYPEADLGCHRVATLQPRINHTRYKKDLLLELLTDDLMECMHKWTGQVKNTYIWQKRYHDGLQQIEIFVLVFFCKLDLKDEATTHFGRKLERTPISACVSNKRFDSAQLDCDAKVLSMTAQAQEITSLKLKVKKLEKKGGSRTHKLKRLYKVDLSRRVKSSEDEGFGEEDASKQGRIADIDADVGINLVSTHFDANTNMFGVHDLVALKSAKPKADKVMLQEPEQGIITTTTAATTVTAASTRPKAKGLVIHVEEQTTTPTISFQQPSQERLTREKDEANVALTEEWNDIQANIDADYQLAQRLQSQEAEEKRNRPPTRAQQRRIMCTYLKNMEGWNPKSLKNKSFANIQELFDKDFKRVNTFVDYRTELIEESSKKAEVLEESSKKAEVEIAQESSSKRAGEALEQESSKKQKVEEDNESKELKNCLEISSDDRDDVTINATPLSTKSPTIIGYKIYKEGKKSYFQIIRADGNSQMYLTFIKMLKNFDR
ncbi:hypothetical protein Tco_0944861, partial [Tanacetum coccineum]